MQSYPHWKPKTKMDDKLLIFEDHDQRWHSGRVQGLCRRTCTSRPVLSSATAVPTSRMQPDILFLQDTDGDDIADVRIATACRFRLGRFTPRHRRLRVGTGWQSVFPRGDVQVLPGRKSLRPDATCTRRASGFIIPRVESSVRSVTSPLRIPGGMSSIAGGKTSLVTHRPAKAIGPRR